MFTYIYHVTIHSITNNRVDPSLTVPLTGTVQAECYSAACTMAWQAINAQCASIRLETGRELCTSDFRVDRVQAQAEPECPEGYFWNGRQCLKQDNLLRPSVYEREAL